PQCQSLPGSASPGRYFDVVEATTRTATTGELVVDGVLRNNCDRRWGALVGAQAVDSRGQEIAVGEAATNVLGPDGRAEFHISLGAVRGVAAVRVTGQPR